MEIDNMEREYADYLTRELTRKGNAISAARKDGKCAHGWRQGSPGSSVPRESDVCKCLHCGKVATWAELDADMHEVFAKYA